MKLFRLPDRLYDALKWLVLIFIPALTAFYVSLCSVFHAPFFAYPEEVAKVSDYLCTFLGFILVISTIEYRKESEEK